MIVMDLILVIGRHGCLNLLDRRGMSLNHAGELLLPGEYEGGFG
jgi:hypothetical protein